MCTLLKKEEPTLQRLIGGENRTAQPQRQWRSALVSLLFLCVVSNVSSFNVISNRLNVGFKMLPTSHDRVTTGFPLGMSSDPETATMSIEVVSADLKATQTEFETKLTAAETLDDIEALRREYLTKKGPVNAAMKYMRDLSNEDKPRLGLVVNEVKDIIETQLEERKEAIEVEVMTKRMEEEAIDVTLPGTSYAPDIGRRHPLSMTMEKAVDIFVSLGYDTVTSVEDSPEIETDYNCFEALNCPKDHPARDMQDTFYLTEDMVRRMLLGTFVSFTDRFPGIHVADAHISCADSATAKATATTTHCCSRPSLPQRRYRCDAFLGLSSGGNIGVGRARQITLGPLERHGRILSQGNARTRH